MTPRKYADTLRRERLRDALRDGDDVTRALFTAGYGSTSRLYEGAHEHLGHDARVRTRPVVRARGSLFTVADTSLGALLVAVTDRGLLQDRPRRPGAGPSRSRCTTSSTRPTSGATTPRSRPSSTTSSPGSTAASPPSTSRSTYVAPRSSGPVWEELRRIPAGETRTYAEVAEAIGAPRASRAVGSACGANPVPIVVPCHRVVPSAGGVGNYGLGPHRKKALLRREGALEAVEQSGRP